MNSSPPPHVSMHGAIDLSGLAARPSATDSDAPSGGVRITEANVGEIIQLSTQRPVIVALISAASPACADLVARLGPLIDSYGDAFAWGTIDIDGEPGLAQAFQVTAVPSVLAILGGRPAPLFQGNADDAQVRSVLDQVVEVARQAGMSGMPTPEDGEAEFEVELPPLHQQAHDALNRNDLEAAAEAYRAALVQNPKDADARAALAQVELMARTGGLDPAEVRDAAAARPDDVDAQLAAADIDIAAGHVEDAFARLISVIRASDGSEREQVRQRLIDLFEVVGTGDPRVVAARQALASALY